MQVHNLPKAKLDKRDVVHVDIVNDSVSASVSRHYMLLTREPLFNTICLKST